MNHKLSPDFLRKVSGAHKYIVSKFGYIDWVNLGELTGQPDLILNHDRLLRSLDFGDDDYDVNALEVIKRIFQADQSNIELVYDFYNIRDWLKEMDVELYSQVLNIEKAKQPSFWKSNHLKLFISHLATEKVKANALKRALEKWGISSFVAHDDIEPTKEWMTEIELALDSMDCLVAMISPAFKNSNWTDQEVGFALGRHIDVVTLRMDADPHGFMSKFQGIQAKGKTANVIACEIATTLFKKPKHRSVLLQALKAFLSLQKSESKLEVINEISKRSLAGDSELKEIIESTVLNEVEKKEISEIILRVGAFQTVEATRYDDDVPF